MIQLSKALAKGRVEIMMDPGHVGELALDFPVFDGAGRKIGKSAVVLTNGIRVNLSDSFEPKQIEGCVDLQDAMYDGKIVIL